MLTFEFLFYLICLKTINTKIATIAKTVSTEPKIGTDRAFQTLNTKIKLNIKTRTEITNIKIGLNELDICLIKKAITEISNIVKNIPIIMKPPALPFPYSITLKL